MSKFAIISDTHIGARLDSLIFDDYFLRFFREIFFPTLKRLGITKVFHLGDVFDRRKYINFNILNRFRRNILHPLEDMGIEIVAISGNHDIFFRNTNEVNALQEILGGWDNIKIYIEPTEIVVDGINILLVPWITQNNLEKISSYLDNTKSSIIMGHFEVNGFQMFRDVECIEGLDRSIFDRFDMVLTGHFHHKNSIDNIHYVGSPYEMTFSDMNDPKGFHIFDSETLELEFIENPFRMFHKIYYDDRGKKSEEILNSIDSQQYVNTYLKVIVNYKTNPIIFDKFIDMLYRIQPAQVNIVEDFNYDFDSSETSEVEDTLSILNVYVDSMDVFDKQKVKDILRGLYIEASNIG
jgi:DNA repair exonuclease SbcCD nuclease subunit